MRKIILVAGLGDNGKEMKIVSNWWKKDGLKPIVFLPNWENNEGVKIKLTRLLKLIDKESQQEKIFILGISAGASLAMNAFIRRKDKIEKIVSLCGRLRMGLSKNKISNKIQKDSLQHRAFLESVEQLESSIKTLNTKDRKKILTVSAKFGDEYIPIGTSKIVGAKNILVPAVEHVMSIFLSMTVNFEPIREFLLRQS